MGGCGGYHAFYRGTPRISMPLLAPVLLVAVSQARLKSRLVVRSASITEETRFAGRNRSFSLLTWLITRGIRGRPEPRKRSVAAPKAARYWAQLEPSQDT